MITLGKIVAAHGIKGWVKVKSFARPEESLFKFEQWWLIKPQAGQTSAVQASSVTATPELSDVLESRHQSSGWVVRLAGVDDRNAAELLRGTMIQLPKDSMPLLSANEFYWSDLIGLSVENASGQCLGRVDSLMETGANDVLVVVDANSKKRCLIPYLPERVIKRIDPSVGIMVVDWDSDF